VRTAAVGDQYLGRLSRLKNQKITSDPVGTDARTCELSVASTMRPFDSEEEAIANMWMCDTLSYASRQISVCYVEGHKGNRNPGCQCRSYLVISHHG